MRRSFVLPSEIMVHRDHDCRAESTKFKCRSTLFDASLFSTLMSRTKSSINLLYDNSMYQPEALYKLKSESSNSLAENRR